MPRRPSPYSASLDLAARAGRLGRSARAAAVSTASSTDGPSPVALRCARSTWLSASVFDSVDFTTSFGHGRGPGDRAQRSLPGAGPVKVITDLGLLEPDPDTRELVLTHLNPGVEVQQAREATGWPLRVADRIGVQRPPDEAELRILRELKATIA